MHLARWSLTRDENRRRTRRAASGCAESLRVCARSAVSHRECAMSKEVKTLKNIVVLPYRLRYNCYVFCDSYEVKCKRVK